MAKVDGNGLTFWNSTAAVLPTKFFHSGYVLHESHLSLQISKHLLSCKWHNSPLRWKYRGSYPGDFLGSDIDALHESSTTSILVKRASSIHVHTTFPYTRFPIEMITSVEVTAISTETAVTSIEEVITNSIEEAAGHFHGSLFLLPRGESPKAFRRRHTPALSLVDPPRSPSRTFGTHVVVSSP